MPAVPYTGVPHISPAGPATPSVSLSTPGAAFGENIGQAQQGLGQTLEKIGGEFEQRATQYQTLLNENWAKDADVDVMIKIGKAQSEFDQLEGSNATAALPGHMERIKQIRQDALGAAPNDMAKKLLDSSISRRVGFSIVDSGNRAGQQAKVASNASTAAVKETAIAVAGAGGDGSLKASADTIKKAVLDQADQHGFDAEWIRSETRKALSKAVLNDFTRNAPSKPIEYAEKLEHIRDQLDDSVLPQVQNIVNRNMAIHGTRIDAQTILAGGEVAGTSIKAEPFDPSKGPGQLERLLAVARKVGELKGKDNPDYADYLEGRVRSQVSLGLSGYRDTQVANQQTVEKFILGQSDKTRVVNIDGVAGPDAPEDVRAAYNSLSPDKQKAVQSFIGSTSKQNIPYTAERQKRFNDLYGQSYTDPKAFAELSVLNEDLPRGKIDQLFARQRQIGTRTAEESTALKDVTQFSGMLNAAGITKARNPDEYNEFVGAFVHDVIEWQGDNKKKMPYDEQYKLAARLLQKTPHTFLFFGGGEYKFAVPAEERKAIIEAYQKDHPDQEPSQAEIRGWYNQRLDAEHRRKQGEGE